MLFIFLGLLALVALGVIWVLERSDREKQKAWDAKMSVALGNFKETVAKNTQKANPSAAIGEIGRSETATYIRTEDGVKCIHREGSDDTFLSTAGNVAMFTVITNAMDSSSSSTGTTYEPPTVDSTTSTFDSSSSSSYDSGSSFDGGGSDGGGSSGGWND